MGVIPASLRSSNTNENQNEAPLTGRELERDDAHQAKYLAVISFPIYYPMDYFLDAFSNRSLYFSFGFLDGNSLLAYIIALPHYVDDKPRAEFYSEAERRLIDRFDEKVAYIASIAVHPSVMRRRLGTRLLDALIEACGRWHPRPAAIFLHVKQDNERAMKFYEKNGFCKDAMIENYYNENSHAYLYVRQLSDAAEGAVCGQK